VLLLVLGLSICVFLGLFSMVSSAREASRRLDKLEADPDARVSAMPVWFLGGARLDT